MMKMKLLSISFVLLFTMSHLYSKEIIIEAETGVLTGTSVSSETLGYSGTGYVTGFDTAGDSVSVELTLASSNTFVLSFGYAAPYGEKTNDIYVNGKLEGSVTFPNINSFTELSWDHQVTLKAGKNTISFVNNWGWMLLDYFKIGGIGPAGNISFSPSNPAITDTMVFDASGISDPNGTVVSLNWDFGDGNTAQGQVVKHRYTNEGIYNVALTATDNDTNVVRKGLQFKVIDGIPVPAVSILPKFPQPGDSVTFDASASVDLNGTIASYEWALDDTILNGKIVKYLFSTEGNYPVILTLTDNQGNKKTLEWVARVYNNSAKVRGFIWNTENIEKYNKAEASFEINGEYKNLYNPDEVKVDAIIKKTGSSDSLVVPCFYFVKTRYNKETFEYSNTETIWKLRFTPSDAGNYKVYVVLKDSTGVYSGNVIDFTVSESGNKGFVRKDSKNSQFFNFDNGTSYVPIGNNFAWTFASTGTDRMETINGHLQSISENGGNWIRYWFASFAQQAIEWTGTDYKGVGTYSQLSAALLDSILENCQEKGVYMQLVFYHHGMFSENVDPDWNSNPFNTANGGFLDKPAKFFTDSLAKTYAKKMMRYAIARWGYSPNIFNWELFNEVNFTGNTNSNPSTLKSDIAKWHDEMSTYIKEVDAHKHLVATSASGDQEQLDLMKDFNAMDILEYHIYNNSLMSAISNQYDAHRTAKNEKTLLCGEFGFSGSSPKESKALRDVFWYCYMRNIPAFYWDWGALKTNNQHTIYKAIDKLFKGIDTNFDLPVTTVSPTITNSSSSMFSVAKRGVKSWYAYVSTDSAGVQTGKVTVDSLNFGYYNLLVLNAVNGDTLKNAIIPIIRYEAEITLPSFETAVALRLTYNSEYTLPIALAGLNQVNYFDNTFSIDGSKSFDKDNKPLTYSWFIASKPALSAVTLSNTTNAKFDFTPDVPGYYKLRLVVNNGTESSAADTITITATSAPIANAGVDFSDVIKKLVYFDASKSYSEYGLPLTYKWALVSKPDGSKRNISSYTAQKIKITADVAGDYVITLVVNDGFADSKPDTIVFTATGSVNIATENKSNVVVSVYPNPAASYFVIRFTQEVNENADIAISDILGKVILKKNMLVSGGEVQVILPADIAQGTYFVRTTLDKNISVHKLIVK